MFKYSFMSEYKFFNNIEDLPFEIRKDFLSFGNLNKTLEETNLLSYHLLGAYEEVLLEQIPIEKYTELHFQIKYLLDEVKISCTKILDFSNLKYISYKKICISLSEDLNYFDVKLSEIISGFLLDKSKFESISIFLSSEKPNSRETEYKITQSMNYTDISFVLENLINGLDFISLEPYKFKISVKCK